MADSGAVLFHSPTVVITPRHLGIELDSRDLEVQYKQTQAKVLNILTPVSRRIDPGPPWPSLSPIAVFRKPLAVAELASAAPAVAGTQKESA